MSAGISKINGKDLSDYKQSPVFIYLFERTISDFYKMSDEDKINLANRYDKEFSQMFSMPIARVVFDQKEMTLEDDVLYLGKLEDINSGFEFIYRYLFAKRQQYQRICINKDDKGSFVENEYLAIKDAYGHTPITKKEIYKPYLGGKESYLLNYNKVDALLFASTQMSILFEMIDGKRIYKNMDYWDNKKLQWYGKKFMKGESKQTENIIRIIEDQKYREKVIKKYKKLNEMYEAEWTFLSILDEKVFDFNNKELELVLLCFHEDIWRNLHPKQKIFAVVILKEFLEKEVFKCNKIDKPISFQDGNNSYDFEDSDKIYVGSLTGASPYSILQKLTYEYAFYINYRNMCELEEDEKNRLFNEYNECKRKYKDNHNYGDIADYYFVKCVRKTAMGVLNEFYKYITNNVVIKGQKIPLSISKEDFIINLYSDKKGGNRHV